MPVEELAVSRSLRSAGALLGLALSLGACASSPGPTSLPPILPSAGAELEMAPPSARDALAEALRQVAEDAPRTRVMALQPPPDGGIEP